MHGSRPTPHAPFVPRKNRPRPRRRGRSPASSWWSSASWMAPAARAAAPSSRMPGAWPWRPPRRAGGALPVPGGGSPGVWVGGGEGPKVRREKGGVLWAQVQFFPRFSRVFCSSSDGLKVCQAWREGGKIQQGLGYTGDQGVESTQSLPG